MKYTVKSVSIDHVKKLFPEIDLIEDPNLREKVALIWQEAFSESSWDKLEDAKFNPISPGVTLVTHTRSVTKGALALAEIHKEFFDFQYDKDELLAVCLLHDVCKLLEQDGDPDGTSHKNKIGKTIQHGFFSGYYAKKYGLSNSIIATVVAHTGNSKTPLRTPEGVILLYADLFDADCHRLACGLELHLDKIKK